MYYTTNKDFKNIFMYLIPNLIFNITSKTVNDEFNNNNKSIYRNKLTFSKNIYYHQYYHNWVIIGSTFGET